jgi:phage gpG-like protein
VIESNIDAVIDRLKAKAAALQDQSVPVAQATEYVRGSIVERFTGENGWAPNSPYTIAQKGSSRPGIDTGALRNSITASVNGNSGQVGTNLRYAKWFNDGTGIFAGHTEWTIKPRKGKMLRFRGPDGFVFARQVVMRGQPARPFMVITDTARERVQKIFRSWAAAILEAA